MFPLRRKIPTLVETRRVQSPPMAGTSTVVIDSTSAPQAAASSPAAPGGATNIFVIGAPAPQAAPPPTEIHHHHTTTVQYVPRKRTPAYNTSFFGSAGVVLGVLAALAAYEAGSYLPFARPLAMAGLIAGGIGFLGAIVFRRTRTGLSMLALVLSASGYVGWMYDSGQLQAQVDEVRTQFPQLPKMDLGQPAVNVQKPPTR